jgi:hypothetical protein
VGSARDARRRAAGRVPEVEGELVRGDAWILQQLSSCRVASIGRRWRALLHQDEGGVGRLVRSAEQVRPVRVGVRLGHRIGCFRWVQRGQACSREQRALN